jgi:hypothetical protein
MISVAKNICICFVGMLLSYSCRTIRPEAPKIAETEIPIAPQPTSFVDIPITVELLKHYNEAEKSVPVEYSGKDEPCQGIRYKYYFKRSPFQIAGNGNQINLKFQGEYSIDLTYCATCAFGTCIVPKISVSCGTGEPLRKMNIGYSSTINISNDYSIKSSTSLTQLEPINKCRVSFLNIDATDRLIEYVRNELNAAGKEVDKNITAYNLRSEVEKLWKSTTSSFKIGDFGFLNINPEAISMSNLNINGSSLKLSVGIAAKPVIKAENIKNNPKTLPLLSSYKPANGFNVFVDLQTSYDSLSKYLTTQFSGKTILIKKRKFTATNFKMYGVGNQKIGIAVDFIGSRKGTVYFTGTPTYNHENHELSFPDLTLDLKTKDILLKLAKWLLNDKFTQTVRTNATYNLTGFLNDTKKRLNGEINRDLGDGISSKGEVIDLDIAEIYPGKSSILLRAFSKGKLEIKIN